MRSQHTLAQTISCKGVGLHTGHPVTLTLRPAAPDTGLIFVRHGVGKSVSVKASVCNLIPTELCTAISVNGTSIKTIEHVLSALVGLEVDNAYVEVDAPEVPVMDGSAAPFVRSSSIHSMFSSRDRFRVPASVTRNSKRRTLRANRALNTERATAKTLLPTLVRARWCAVRSPHLNQQQSWLLQS